MLARSDVDTLRVEDAGIPCFNIIHVGEVNVFRETVGLRIDVLTVVRDRTTVLVAAAQVGVERHADLIVAISETNISFRDEVRGERDTIGLRRAAVDSSVDSRQTGKEGKNKLHGRWSYCFRYELRSAFVELLIL